MSQPAFRRLLKDFKELRASPLYHANAAPLGDDLLTWHGNFRGTSEPFKHAIFHFHLLFTEDYPKVAPTLKLCTHIPHRNVFNEGDGYRLCLDMLEKGDFSSDEQKGRPYTGWTSCYTVSAILLQLQSFIMDENFLEKNNVHKLQNAIQSAKSFTCSCNHTAREPYPDFPTWEDIEESHAQKIEIGPPIIPRQPVRKAIPARPPQRVPASANASVRTPVRGPAPAPAPAPTPAPDPAPAPAPVQPPAQVHTPAQVPIPAPVHTPAPVHSPTPVPSSVPAPATTSSLAEISVPVQHDAPKLDQAKTSEPLKSTTTTSASSTKSVANKNNKSQKQSSVEQQKPEPPVGKFPLLGRAIPFNDPLNRPRPAQTSLPPAPETTLDITSYIELKKKKEITKVDTGKFKGIRMIIPYEVWIKIFHMLRLQDLVTCAIVSKEFKRMAEDGYLWKTLFCKYYPHSQFTAKNMADWKYIFQVELVGILESLKCFHTKLTFEEDVLGIPLETSFNPRTERIQYIYSTMDILSSQAFFKDKIRKTVWKEDFSHFLPLYITRDHFKRALPTIQRGLVALSGHWHTRKFSPIMAIEVIPKLMNTMVVLVCDKGVHVSEKVLNGYCALHRLMIAFVQEYPSLLKHVDSLVNQFLTDDNARHKSKCENLGDFWPLLSISSIPWHKVAPVILSEQFDRNVLWICKAHPSLADLGNVPAEERLTKTFDAIKVSLKLAMFHLYFLKQFRSKPSLVQIAAEYDQFYGAPSHKNRVHFQQNIQKIVGTQNWSQFFKQCNLPSPSPTELASKLKQAVKNSLKKGYHTKTTDFSSIHKSGVSKILLKGESYTCNTALQRVYLEEVWSYPTYVIFLDASCLLFDFKDNFVEVVDFARKKNASESVVHSGDVIDHDKCSGKHTINVDLTKIPNDIKSMYFTITAWTTSLQEILTPYILFIDPDTKQELCTYQFVSKDTGDKTAVIMAKMSREQVGKPWKVLAVGHLGMGRASNYAPIQDDIAAHWQNK